MKMLIPVILMFICGCTAFAPVDANKWAKDFYSQNKQCEVIHISWKGQGSITISATDFECSIKTPIAPLSMIPRDATVWDGIKDLLPFAAITYIASQGINKSPTVVSQPTQIIEQPTIWTP